MRQIFISLIRPHMDYCAQLWAPSEGPMLDKLEKILYDYTKYIPEICNLSYERRLKAMKLQSVQRRYDGYRILYTRKCALDLVPNCNIIIRRDATYRNGTMMEVPPLKGMSKLRRDCFMVRGPELFNCIPSYLRDTEVSIDTLKTKLDEFLSLIPDSPRIDVGSKLHSNELDFAIKKWTWSLGCG